MQEVVNSGSMRESAPSHSRERVYRTHYGGDTAGNVNRIPKPGEIYWIIEKRRVTLN